LNPVGTSTKPLYSAVHPPAPARGEHNHSDPLLPPGRAPQDYQARRMAPLRHQWRVDLGPHVPHVDHDDACPA
jgi:hypothetical protein